MKPEGSGIEVLAWVPGFGFLGTSFTCWALHFGAYKLCLGACHVTITMATAPSALTKLDRQTGRGDARTAGAVWNASRDGGIPSPPIPRCGVNCFSVSQRAAIMLRGGSSVGVTRQWGCQSPLLGRRGHHSHMSGLRKQASAEIVHPR